MMTSLRAQTSRSLAMWAAKSREVRAVPCSSQAMMWASVRWGRMTSASAALPGFFASTSTISTGPSPSARPEAVARSA